LKRLASDLIVGKLVLKDIASGNFEALNDVVTPYSMRSRSMLCRSELRAAW
jgi:hypothetical protein